jgi:hypothetical protein
MRNDQVDTGSAEPPKGQPGSGDKATMEPEMSTETPKDDPRQATDDKSLKQTDKPWNGPVEKEQKRTGPPPDLEKWQEADTH